MVYILMLTNQQKLTPQLQAEEKMPQLDKQIESVAQSRDPLVEGRLSQYVRSVQSSLGVADSNKAGDFYCLLLYG